MIRNTFRLVARQDWDAVKRDIKPIYTAPSPDAAAIAMDELEEKWRKKYGAMIRLWRNAWEEFIPFLDYDVEIRRMICSTNAMQVVNLDGLAEGGRVDDQCPSQRDSDIYG